jgi:hypothetical protein
LDFVEIENFIISEIANLLRKNTNEIDWSISLIGSGGLLDSMALVELCLKIEDFAISNGSKFDWTSENAMSRTKSTFRDVKTLSFEVFEQSKIN